MEAILTFVQNVANEWHQAYSDIMYAWYVIQSYLS